MMQNLMPQRADLVDCTSALAEVVKRRIELDRIELDKASQPTTEVAG
jgi:hypothetical protein